MRVLMTGGGTAGHINPALAIAETIKKNDPDAVIEFVGVKTGKENDLVPREGYPLHFVKSFGIRRSLSPANIKTLWVALTSPYSKETVGIIQSFKPDIVIGTGGYASWPIMAAAARMKIPTAVHESNVLAGLTVKRLQKKVDRVWINFEKTREQLSKRAHVVQVGNPLRSAFGTVTKEEAKRALGIGENQKLILSFGGSLGAAAINQAVIDLMRASIVGNPNVIHVHAAGKGIFAETEKRFSEMGLKTCANCFWVDYIYDMPLHMAAADLVISRAGAMTLSELALMKKSAILIPSPNVADNHQYKNAKALADAGAAVLIEEKNLQAGALTESVTRLLADGKAREKMEKSIASFADADANKRIWNEIVELVKKK